MSSVLDYLLEEEVREVPVFCKGVIINGSHKRQCSCQGTNKTFHRVHTKNHGDIFLCPDCYSKGERDIFTYSQENGVRVNGQKKHGFTWSIEMELTSHNDAFCRTLQYNNFMPTYDCTVAVEYKSPIYQSLNGVRKLLRSLRNELNDDYFNYRCGTHCNVGHDMINSVSLDYIRHFYHSLFMPLSNWLLLNPEATEKVFGRQLSTSYSDWAIAINQNSEPLEHKNFINLQHDTHIEFRLCKFRDEYQYVDCMDLCRKFVDAIITNFVEHFNDDDFDTRRYKTLREYRQHKAVVAGKKLISLIEKYCDKNNIAYTSL